MSRLEQYKTCVNLNLTKYRVARAQCATISKNNARQLIQSLTEWTCFCQLCDSSSIIPWHIFAEKKRKKKKKYNRHRVYRANALAKLIVTRELPAVRANSIYARFSRTLSSFHDWMDGGFIQLIRVTAKHAIRPRREHVLGGFDSQLAHVRRWSVVFAR